jgi:hypothetical protein
MTNDIVERLRESAEDWKFEADNAGRTGGVEELLAEAADEIERLQKERDTWCATANYIEQTKDAEIERLRAYLLGIAQGTNEEWTHNWALAAIETSDLFVQPKAPAAQEPKP